MSAWVRGIVLLAGLAAVAPLAGAGEDAKMWTIYITHDNCPDYTWGFSEEQTRKAFADIVRGHLDEMTRTDGEAPENRDRYNMAVAQEALCFAERYPERKAELIRRIKEGRVFVSPYLCNSLWAFQSVESAIRTFYPARRLEREWGIAMDVAEHIEEPSLPWGVASILAGCGVRWLSNPFYAYDSTFRGLTNPPLFVFEGPDGSRVRVVMDPWACNRASYTQGGKLLREPDATRGWIEHYAKLGEAYPLSAVLASGTHGDIHPGSGGQARGFAEKIIALNGKGGDHPKLVNATLPQFCEAVDAAEAKAPFLKAVRGCFGHSWDLWPVCLAKHVAAMREGGRAFLAAESLAAIAGLVDAKFHEATRPDRERAEWCWAMLSDHAWNGTGDGNKLHNAELRRGWAQELNALASKLRHEAWAALGLDDSRRGIALFNPLNVPRRGLVRLAPPPDARLAGSQVVDEGGTKALYFVSPEVAGFGLATVREGGAEGNVGKLRATATELESPFYRLRVDPQTGGIASLVHKATGREIAAGGRRTLCQTVYHDGKEHALGSVATEVAAVGPVLARLRITGTAAGYRSTTLVTVYQELDRVDFDVRIMRPATRKQERLCHVFPIVAEGAMVRIETTGTVVRPFAQPRGDLLPGADTRRFAVQGFVDASTADFGVTVAPLDAFVLRMDLDPLSFEALGNDQNYREVVQDQHGVTDFRFRYALRAHAGGYNGAEAFAWSRSAASSLLVAEGAVPAARKSTWSVRVDPARAIATCLKPADDPQAGGLILRLWETAGRSGPLAIGVPGFTRALRTDLLERDLAEPKMANGELTLDLRGHGFAAVRLLP